jgi:hypothetical protein
MLWKSMANTTTSALVPTEHLPHVERAARWFFTMKSSIPGRFFYYNDGSNTHVIPVVSIIDFFPEAIYHDGQLIPENMELEPAPLEAMWAWKYVVIQLSDNMSTPWNFQVPSDEGCEIAFHPWLNMNIKEITAEEVNGELVLTHSTPAWALNGRKRMYLLQRRSCERRSRYVVCSSSKLLYWVEHDRSWHYGKRNYRTFR